MERKHVDVSVDIGATIGSIIAFALSYNTWHSIGWAIIHAIFGWFYDIYFAIVYTDTLKNYLDHLFGIL